VSITAIFTGALLGLAAWLLIIGLVWWWVS